MSKRGRVFRLYQWLSRRARFSGPDSSIAGLSRTVRTEVTIERQGTALFVGGAPADPIHTDRCPLCGHKLATAQEEPPRFGLQKDSTSQAQIPADDSNS